MTTLFAIPAFMGQANDWHGFQFECELDTFSFDRFGTWLWVGQVALTIMQRRKQINPRILMGYSLGGRLAMHALTLDHNMWDGAIIISAHPGLKSVTEKHARLREDETWMQRFRSDPWDLLMQDWNNQAIFAGKPPIFERMKKIIIATS